MINREFDFEAWKCNLFRTKEEAEKGFEKLNIVDDEIEEFIILDEDSRLGNPNYFENMYINEVVVHQNESPNQSIESINESILQFKRDHKAFNMSLFPQGFKSSFVLNTCAPLVLKMKSGKQIEIFLYEDLPERVIELSINQLADNIKNISPIMDYNKFYRCILNKKIVAINFDATRYFRSKDFKLDEHGKISCINIEFENGIVLRIHSTPFSQNFMLFDINEQTFDLFTINDFKNSFYG